MPTLEELRYPIGKFSHPEEVTPAMFEGYVSEIESLPVELRKAVKDLTEEQLDTPYREDGWTVRQVVHHLFDSHVNSYIRLKFALTEENPTIMPYEESLWAELYDGKHGDTEISLALLEGLHKRWVMTLRNLSPEQKKRTFNHPETGAWSVEKHTALYAWHSKHHTSHIAGLRNRMGW